MKCPRVLVCSLNCFTKSGANGRILGDLFVGWNPECVAQFYVTDELPDYAVCRYYYRITDRDILKGTIIGNKIGGGKISLVESDENPHEFVTNLVKRNPRTRLMRDILWNLHHSLGKDFNSWLNAYDPEVVLLQVGGSSFMPKIAMSIAKRRRIPLVVFNTENYYFNRASDRKYMFSYFLYHSYFKRVFRKLMKLSSQEIYCNQKLVDLYYQEFGKRGELIYQSTSLPEFTDKSCLKSGLKFCYAGNLGLKRAFSLIELANCLQEISDQYYVDVYGSIKDSTSLEALKNCSAIKYHGVVQYSEVLFAMGNTDFMIHTESFDEEIVQMIRTGFSTKIADCLASGKCLILYADSRIACTEYLLKNDCACVITKKEDLKDKLLQIINNPALREYYSQKGIETASRNHNSQKNAEKFRQVILRCVGWNIE